MLSLSSGMICNFVYAGMFMFGHSRTEANTTEARCVRKSMGRMRIRSSSNKIESCNPDDLKLSHQMLASDLRVFEIWVHNGRKPMYFAFVKLCLVFFCV